MEKYCKKCDTTKPVSEFHKHARRKDGLTLHCGQCNNQKQKEWRENNPDYNKDYCKEWRKNNPDYYKEWSEKYPEKRKEKIERGKYRRIEQWYEITIEHYNNLLDQQNNRCAICREEEKNGRALAIDHDHSCCPGKESCGKCVRQLLCMQCNLGIGNFRDNPQLLRQAAESIENHRQDRRQ